MRPSSLLAALTTVVAVAATAVAVQSAGPVDASTSDHGHGGVASSAAGPAPEDLLLRADDLPEGWRVPVGSVSSGDDSAADGGAADGEAADGEAADGEVPDGGGQGDEPAGVCGPLTALVSAHGTHTGAHGDQHGAARAVFTRSHFGPDLTQVVTDLGSEAAAQAELAELATATGACGVLTREGDGHSATIDFAVQPLQPLQAVEAGDGAVGATLTARGSDFTGVRQELRVVRTGSLLVALTYATQTGAEATDLPAALAAAVERASSR